MVSPSPDHSDLCSTSEIRSSRVSHCIQNVCDNFWAHSNLQFYVLSGAQGCAKWHGFDAPFSNSLFRFIVRAQLIVWESSSYHREMVTGKNVLQLCFKLPLLPSKDGFGATEASHSIKDWQTIRHLVLDLGNGMISDQNWVINGNSVIRTCNILQHLTTNIFTAPNKHNQHLSSKDFSLLAASWLKDSFQGTVKQYVTFQVCSTLIQCLNILSYCNFFRL